MLAAGMALAAALRSLDKLLQSAAAAADPALAALLAMVTLRAQLELARHRGEVNFATEL